MGTDDISSESEDDSEDEAEEAQWKQREEEAKKRRLAEEEMRLRAEEEEVRRRLAAEAEAEEAKREKLRQALQAKRLRKIEKEIHDLKEIYDVDTSCVRRACSTRPNPFSLLTLLHDQRHDTQHDTQHDTTRQAWSGWRQRVFSRCSWEAATSAASSSTSTCLVRSPDLLFIYLFFSFYFFLL